MQLDRMGPSRRVIVISSQDNPRPTQPQVRLGALMLLLAAALGGTGHALAQEAGTVSGVVVDAQTQRLLVGVQILVEGTTASAITDGAGRFRITGLEGEEVVLEANMIGYRRHRQTVR